MFDTHIWTSLPFHFWSVVFFVLGCNVGSFLNVCIYRMPLDLSVIKPPSHCPKCKYQIPWYMNIPLLTWLVLRGKCANCKAGISVRYFLVEFLTGCIFFAVWLMFGNQEMLATSIFVSLVFCVFMAGLMAATFIDLEHFIIPDEITIGGIGVGFVLAALVPQIFETSSRPDAMKASVLGIVVGGGIVYAILRIGKLLFGRQEIELPAETRITFTENAIVLPDGETPYEDIFYRDSDAIVVEGTRLELPDRCYSVASVSLSPKKLTINGDEFDPEKVGRMEITTSELTLPREAMGFGDVKFMAGIGAFIGWQGALFSLMFSSMLGATAGVLMILIGKREWSSRIPYGPYIAVAAAMWVFGGKEFVTRWFYGG